jgi:diguanylate cyclase (GGDEF)-like protein
MMSPRPIPTDAVLHARRYAARARITLALAGAVLIAVDPSVDAHPVTAALGCVVIFLSGLVVYAIEDGLALRVEEPVSCLAAVLIIGFGYGEVTPISMIWLVAAAVGVLARGGRVGGLARLIVAAMLLSPIVTTGTLSGENIILIVCTGALLLSTGRVTLETAELLARARYDADHDALTGALSIRALRTRLEELAATGRPLFLMVVDLDDFAHVNKRRGHAAGDALLQAVAAAIEDQLGLDDVLARIDGDAMGVIGFHGDGTTLATTVMAAIATVGSADRITASIGIARAPRDGMDAEALLGAADVALRIAKRTGKNRASLYAGDPLTTAGSGGARDALAAIVEGNGLWMAVQPIVDTFGGKVHGYEALARFDGGQGPLHWLELAEELGMRPELEIACLRKTLELLDELPVGTRLTVNLSVPMLCDPTVADLLNSRTDLGNLIVEVTEEALASDNEVMFQAIADLRDRGVLFAVDDIGAGYSGLGQLATLRPAYLKLDRGLVQGLDGDPTRASLVAAMNSYASATDALLIAEGIETEDELLTLSQIGVPLLQGFLLARPAEPWPQPAARRALKLAA